MTSWLPGLLEDLLPTVTRTVRSLAVDAGLEPVDGDWSSIRQGRVAWRLTEQLAPEVLEGSHQPDVDVEKQEYLLAAVRWALPHQCAGRKYEEQLHETLTKIGTGRGSWNAGLPALRVVAALLAEAPERPVLRVYLDAETWADLDDRKTGARALAGLTLLATAADVELVFSSPRLRRLLTMRFGRLLEAHLDLTEIEERSRSLVGAGARTREAAEATAWRALGEISDGDGKLRILANVPRNGSREVRMLRQDPEIGLQGSSIDAYVSALEGAQLLDVDRSRRYNRVSLTPAGRVAREYVTADYAVRDRQQADLGTFLEVPPVSGGHLTETPQAAAGTVYGASGTREGDQVGGRGREPSAEDVLARTGNPAETGDYVRWLPGAGRLSPWAMHKRITAARRGDGINLVDDQIRWWGRKDDPESDARVTYISCFDDEFLVLAQWGDVLPTLARITGALLSDRALSKVLVPDRVGESFEELNDGAIADLDDRVDDVIRWGHQVGWFGEDEAEWNGWRERVGSVKAFLLKRVAEVQGTDDVDERSRVIKDLLGLLTSATHLYHAAGIDVVINLRVPDLYELVRDDQRLNNFLGFLRYTATKQTTYKHHSGYRMLLEDRSEKLKKRLEYRDDLDLDDIRMETTADWVLSGRTMSKLQVEIERALEAEQLDVREAVQEGVEQAAVMEIPVRNANTYAAIKDVVEEFARVKGFQNPRYAAQSTKARESIDRLTRVSIQSLSTEDQPGRCCPHDVAEALLRLARADRVANLDVDDVAYGLSQLPPERVFKMLTPSTSKLLQELLAADEPLRRSELVERAGISTDTYDRNIDELAALDLVEPRQVDGYKRWEAHLEPWWQPHLDRREPFSDDTETGCWPNPKEQDLVAELIYELDLDVDDSLLIMVTREKLDQLYAQSRVLERWRGFIQSAIATGDELKRGPPDRAALIGRLPPGVEPEQLRLASQSAFANNWPVAAADGGKPADTTGAGYE